ncbi:Amino acid transporter AVT3B [Hondaea fermentalgiana]|uniref:Amino acid transporter AVT3B n=1 Tax=Hondaea fermentalgiana TaxID=2315210 RepID=A0A2R5GNW3_9STRA|nr:Amino acid transporter AVT3B [Hondaea fermentalgiana]|eukprot:GBG29564.1 Amino acid transporter AVT3B [Hondaea fermentalgiana]
MGLKKYKTPEFGLMFKSVVGSGAFALPYAMREAGVLGGSIVVLVVAAFSVETTKQLIKSAGSASEEYRRRTELDNLKRSEIGFTQVADVALGKWAWIVSVSIFAAQFCAVATYFVFFDTTLSPMLGYLIYGEDRNGPHHVLVRNVLLLVLVAIQVGLAMAPDPSFLQNTSKFGNIIFMVSLGFIVVFSAWYAPPTLANVHAFETGNGIVMAFGVTCFTLAAPAESLGIYSTASTKGRKKFEEIVNAAYAAAILLYLFVAVYSYACFGKDTEQIIFTNLTASHSVLGYLIQTLMSAMLCCNFPLSFFPVHQMVEQTFKLESETYKPGLGFKVARIGHSTRMDPTERSKLIESISSQESQSSAESDDDDGTSALTTSQIISRTVLVLATGVLAWLAGDKFAMISTVGGAFTAVIAFILPPIMNMRLHGGWSAQSWPRIVLNICIIAVGCWGGAQSLYDGVKGLMK